MKFITCKGNIDIVTSSTRDRNDVAVVMQLNFSKLKSEINASQRINASQSLKKVWGYRIQFHDISKQLEQWYDELKSSTLLVGDSQNTNRSL